MAEKGVDVLMLVTSKNRPMPAESTTVIDTQGTDTLGQGFIRGQCCELKSFGFAAGVASALSRDKDKKEKQTEESDKELKPRLVTKTQLIRSQQEKYDKRHQAEFIDMQPVIYTRLFDTASTLLFNALVGCDTVDSVSIIKRKGAGGKASGLTYLRLDFTKVLVTSIDWKDASPFLVETGSFIYRQLRMRYRPQKADGSLGTTIESSWTMQSSSK